MQPPSSPPSASATSGSVSAAASATGPAQAPTQTLKLLARRDAAVARGVGRISPLAIERAEGCWLVDADGRRFLDFAGGIGVMSVGHSQPAILEAIVAQVQKLQHTCIHVATYEPYVALCETLVERFPHGRVAGEGTRAMLVNSGAEAVENAIKIARQTTGRPAILCFTEGFHGRTLMAMTLTSKAGYKVGCGPYAPEVYRLPYPNYYHRGDGLTPEQFVARELQRFRDALVNTVPASQVAGVILEVVQGEGGFVPCPPTWLQGIRTLCDEIGALLILDEVQSGFCRTGRWAAYEHMGVTPDLSTWAKALGAGTPIAAVIGRAQVMDRTQPGTLGGTYGGNPISCAAALASVALMERESLCARAEQLGQTVHARLLGLQQRYPIIGDVRGLGAMQAIELVEGGNPARPASAVTARILAAALERGLLLIAAGAHSNVLRLLPPLILTEHELDTAFDILEASFAEVLGVLSA